MADALSQALAWRARIKQLRKLRAERAPVTSSSGIFARYHDDPVGFAVDILGITPWERQVEILKSIAHHPKVAVRSGHKVGKTNSIAIATLWWFATRLRAKVVLTSSTDAQIETQLWPEIRGLYSNAKVALGGKMNLSHQTGLRAEDGRHVFGISTNKTDNMGGHSGAELLFLADEASGIKDVIFQAIEGNLAGGGRLGMFGNPIRTSGTFFEAFHSKAEFWHRIHVSSAMTPNVVSGQDLIPGLATRAWVELKTREHGGPGDPQFDVRVAGNFPQQSENAIIGLSDVDDAQQRWRMPVATDGVLELGVDVARFGDDETVIYARRGNYFYPPVVLRSMDGIDVAGHVLKMVRELRVGTPVVTTSRTAAGEQQSMRLAEVPKVKIDVTGGTGGSPFDVLKRHRDEVEAIGITVSESATEERFSRLRDQLWFAARDFLRQGGAIPDDPALVGELIGPTYKFDIRGRIKVESKDEMKARLENHRSPDRADALALAIYQPKTFKAASSPATFMDY